MRFFQGRWLAGVGLVVVLIGVVVGAFAFGMLPLSGDAAVEPALGPGRIAFVSGRDGDDEIYVMNADGSGVVQLTDNDSDDLDPAWSPDGKRIAFVSDRDNDAEIFDIYVMNADGSGVVQLTDDCSNNAPAWSPDGGRVGFSSRGNVYVMNADSSGAVQLTGTPLDSCAQLFVSIRDGEPAWYVRNADGSVELFTDRDAIELDYIDSGPEWSPDGSRMALQSIRDGDFGIYVMNADGSSFEQLNEDDGNFVWGVSWSPDGSRIAFSSGRESHVDDLEVHVMNADGSGVVQLTDNDASDFDPAWSPDGSRIAFASRADGDADIYVMNADGSAVMQLSDGHSPAWSPLLD